MVSTRRIIYATGSGKAGSSINALFYDLKKGLEGVKIDMDDAAQQAADIILKNTLPLTPLDKGPLRDSGVATTERSKNGVRAKVTFGNDEVDYAVIVHEDMEPKNWTTPGTGPKYLTRGATASVQQIKALYKKLAAASVKKRFRR